LPVITRRSCQEFVEIVEETHKNRHVYLPANNFGTLSKFRAKAENERMATFFVTGIDTGIGKTIATGLAARYLHRQGKKVITQKLVQTGQHGSISEDILEHRHLMGTLTSVEDSRGLTCPYSFAYPASPHFAASLEKTVIEPKKLARATEILQNHYDYVLLEGAGGFLVPLAPDLWIGDYIEQRGYPVILVTSGRLGSINHTLLTIEAIRRRNLSLACLVFNQHPPEDEAISNDSLALFRKIFPHVVVLPLVDSDRIPEIDFSCLR